MYNRVFSALITIKKKKMKTKLLIVTLSTVNLVYSQSGIDTTIKVDLLKAPSSPASNLLGIAPSDIEKPTDVSAFMLSLQSATNSFIKLPSNYAVDIAPYWVFKNSKKGDITTEGFRKSSGKNVFKQTLVFSFAFRNPDSTETELNFKSFFGGFGFKFSLFRGHYDNTTNQALNTIKRIQNKRLKLLEKGIERSNTDSLVLTLENRRKDMLRGKTPLEIANILQSNEYKKIGDSLNLLLLEFKNESIAEQQEALDKEIQSVASTFQTTRIGFTWDIAGGASTEFRNKRFDNTKLYNAGLWTTIGYTDSVFGSGLFLIRLLHNPDKIFAKDNMTNDIDDITTFDAGLRYIYARSQSKFSASLEAIYRSVLSSETIEPSWRLVFNAEYAIWQNQKLTFSFGRNFDGTVTKDGNLIAALTFLTGFGNRR